MRRLARNERGIPVIVAVRTPPVAVRVSIRNQALRVLFVNPRAYLPQLLGGVETTTLDLCRQLAQMGHATAVMCGLSKYDVTWLRNRIVGRLTGRAFPRERYRGSSVYRGWLHERGLR